MKNHFTKKCTKANEFDKCFESVVTAEEKAGINKCI